jgi:hypothetical protein
MRINAVAFNIITIIAIRFLDKIIDNDKLKI